MMRRTLPSRYFLPTLRTSFCNYQSLSTLWDKKVEEAITKKRVLGYDPATYWEIIKLTERKPNITPQKPKSLLEFNNKIKELCENKQNKDAQYYFYAHQTSFNDISSVNTLIRSLTKNKEFFLAYKIFGKAKQLGYSLTTETYNLMMRGVLLYDDINEVNKLYKELLEKNLKPTKSTFSILLSAYARSGDLTNSESQLETIGVENATITDFACLARAYAKAQAFEKLESLENTLQKANINKDDNYFSGVIYELGLQRNIELLLKYVNQAVTNGSALLWYAYSLVKDFVADARYTPSDPDQLKTFQQLFSRFAHLKYWGDDPLSRLDKLRDTVYLQSEEDFLYKKNTHKASVWRQISLSSQNRREDSWDRMIQDELEKSVASKNIKLDKINRINASNAKAPRHTKAPFKVHKRWPL